MWKLDSKEGWALKNWCFQTVVLKTLESPLDCKEIQPVHPKGNQSWIFIRRTDAEAESPIPWPPDVKSSHWKRPWCWGRLKARGEGDDRRWYGWKVSLTQWTWVWVNSRSPPKPMSIESVMPSNYLILCCPLLLPPSIFPSIRVFSNESVLSISGRSIGVSASASVLPMNIQDRFSLGWTGWISLLSKGLSKITVQKHQFFSTQLYL